jgi:segregation and condensation protein A
MSPSDFAAVAAKALEPREPAPTEVGIGHLHAPAVSVREQADIIGHRLQEQGTLSFRQLTADAESLLVVVARFLALLEMFRDMAITMDQAAPLGELTVRWSAGERNWSADSISEEYDADDEGRSVQPVTGRGGEGGVHERTN